MASADWVNIKYKYNRAIFFDGDLPHLATPTTHLAPDRKRVILGFNCFTDHVAKCNLRAPEHSDAFNRTIKLYQTIKSIDKRENQSSSKKSITAKDLMKNPALARLIVQAAKKVKEHEQGTPGKIT
jgi:hypothetical protein